MEKKNINEKKEKVCYLIETKDEKYIEFVEKKNVRTFIKNCKQTGKKHHRLTKEQYLKYEKNNFEGLGKKI